MEHCDQRPCPEPSFHCLLPTYVCLSVGLCTYYYMTCVQSVCANDCLTHGLVFVLVHKERLVHL